MADNNNSGVEFIIDGEENVRKAMYIRLAHGLALEINTGLSHSRGSQMLVANRLSGSTKRTKKGALKDYVAWLKVQLPGWEPGERIVLAMGGKKK